MDKSMTHNTPQGVVWWFAILNYYCAVVVSHIKSLRIFCARKCTKSFLRIAPIMPRIVTPPVVEYLGY